MAVTNGWGQGVINNTNGWGKLATNNIGAGSVYENSSSGDTALIGTSASFSYSASSFAQADADPTPTITGTTGGTFSGTSGLVFVSTSTGQIDLSASTIAAHVVTYTVGGVSSNFNLSVTAAPFSNTLSYNFDGTDDFITINTNTTLNNIHLNPFSISLWFKTSTGGTMILTEKATSSSGSARAFYVYLSSGVVIWYGATSSPSYSNGSYNDGNWHHLACVAESDTVARIYVDGVDDTNNIAKDRIGTSTVNADINIGTTFNASGFFFNGNIDEYAIFNYGLTSSNVTSIYNSGVPNNLNDLSTPPTVWYRCGENSNYKSPQWLMPENSNKDKFSNYSYELDGTDDFIDFGSFPEYSNVSVSCWINIKARTNYGRIIQKGSLSESGWGIFQSAPAQKLEAFYYTGSTLYITRATNAVNLNEWVHFAFTYSSGSNPIIYINGVAETFASGISSVGSSSNNLEIGRKAGANSAFSNFAIDEVSIYNSALSASDISSIYNGGVPTTITGATNHYRMGEEATFSTNWTIPDQAGSNDGTSNNMTIEDRIGDSPNSTNNSVSFNMTESDRQTDVPT